MMLRWIGILGITAVMACKSAEPSGFGECGADEACTRVSVCLCNRTTTCADICALGAGVRKDCLRYGPDGMPITTSVTADDCAACRAVEMGFDPATDCKAPISCPSGCNMPSCCATASDCGGSQGCVQGCCRTFTRPPDLLSPTG